ncbi:helix-turn-helix transcriptional regulator [Streptomyces sp. MI02-7b]|nr:helix-turn-helix transcriptional regulator [Streptomyces sp. MI02-7b]MDX3074928.1 helix-turn-helix transcriptional regulator [Streptomyces sp. MI02-7b]
MDRHRRAGTVISAQSPEGAVHYRADMVLTAEEARVSERHFMNWERGPFSHLIRLAVPDFAVPRGFRFVANGHLIDGLLSAEVYCDTLTGVSGNHLDQDPIVADLVTSGWIEFLEGKEKHSVKPGQICVRDTKASWEFSCAPATTAHVISIPRHLVLPHIGSGRTLGRAHISDVDVPEVRFFVNFLEVIKKSSSELEGSASARTMARDACATLFSHIISERPGSALSDHPRAVVAAAKNVIEENLESGDLSPPMVAKSVGVSLRTLHRCFSASDDSVMAFARRRRLQKAHDELMTLGSAAGMSEIAARWHFSDASHFIRHFKSAYGATPAAYLRERR